MWLKFHLFALSKCLMNCGIEIALTYFCLTWQDALRTFTISLWFDAVQLGFSFSTEKLTTITSYICLIGLSALTHSWHLVEYNPSIKCYILFNRISNTSLFGPLLSCGWPVWPIAACVHASVRTIGIFSSYRFKWEEKMLLQSFSLLHFSYPRIFRAFWKIWLESIIKVN